MSQICQGTFSLLPNGGNKKETKRAYSWVMKLKNETLNNSNRYLTGDELDILLGNVHDPCKYFKCDNIAIVRHDRTLKSYVMNYK